MLNYKSQYRLATSVYVSFIKNNKIKVVGDSDAVIERSKTFLNYRRFETFEKKLFTLACVKTMIKETPTSKQEFFRLLSEQRREDVEKFLNDIDKHFENYIAKDIEYIYSTYSLNPNASDIAYCFYENKIKWFSAKILIDRHYNDLYSTLSNKLTFAFKLLHLNRFGIE